MFLVLAVIIIAAGVLEAWEPNARPQGQIDLSLALPDIPRLSEPVTVTPHSVFKYTNVVRQAYDYSCGSAALTTVLKYYLGQTTLDERAAMEGMLEYGEKDKIAERRGFSLLDMKRYVAALGFRSGGFRAEIEDLIKLEQPGIVPITYANFKHFVVLREYRDGHFYVADPAMGNISFTAEYFASIWDQNVLFLLYPREDTPALNQLQLTDADLRIMDMDRFRSDARMFGVDFTQRWLERAVDTAAGTHSYFNP